MHLIPTQEITADFAAMRRAAGRHLSARLQGASDAWLRCRLGPPMLEHLAFRLGNQLFFIRLDDVDEIVAGPASLDGLLSAADRCRGHACLMPMRHAPDGWRPASPGWGLVDARTGAPVEPPALVTDALVEMTDSEVHHFAVQVVRDELECEGRKVQSSQSNLDVDPALWFTGDHGPEWVVVRAVRHPPGDAPVPRNWRQMEAVYGQRAYPGSLGIVIVASASDDLSDRSRVTPLWRGYPMQYVYEGLARVRVMNAQTPDGPAALVFWPTVDDDEMATACREALDIPRARAAELGRSAVAAIRDGGYRTSSGHWVDWRALVDRAVGAKVSLPADAVLPPAPARDPDDMRVTVVNDTTLREARRLIDLSPDVPVFRTDAGDALEQPWLLSVLTCAAPYAPAIGQPEAGDLLAERIRRVLAIARAYGYDAMVLGAWGCGAFGNEVERTAIDFRAALSGEFAGAFRDVVFAIADWSKE